MKHFALVILAMSFLMINCSSDRRGDKISLIAELPNTAEYAIDGAFVDVGIVYNAIDYEGVSFFNFNKRWCLFNGNSYWVMDKERLDEIAQLAGITLPKKIALPFWDEWGGRILLVSIGIVFILGSIIWSKIQPKLKILKPVNSTLNSKTAATLIFHKSYKIKKYNGLNVRWSAFFAKASSIYLPSGECIIVFDLKENYGADVKTAAHNHSAKNNIEAGKKYFLKSYLNDLDRDNILTTFMVEYNENELDKYVSGFAINRASWLIKRVGTNITPDKAQKFVNDFFQQIKNEGYNFVDERSGNAEKLYFEFSKFPVTILDGEIYTYKKGNWLLLISRGELGVMFSFSNSLTTGEYTVSEEAKNI
jgi:hypothetical protein